METLLHAGEGSDRQPGNELLMRCVELVRKRAVTVGTAESCTGGLLASTFTDVAGSSAWFMGAVVAYRAELKRRLLAVPGELLERDGEVSRQCAEAMAEGASRLLGCDAALSVTGLAGPGGDGRYPVGTVFIAWSVDGGKGRILCSRRHLFSGDRQTVKYKAVESALSGLCLLLEGKTPDEPPIRTCPPAGTVTPGT